MRVLIVQNYAKIIIKSTATLKKPLHWYLLGDVKSVENAITFNFTTYYVLKVSKSLDKNEIYSHTEKNV